VKDYIGSKAEGIHKTWFENGNLSSEISYKNSLKVGTSKTWYESGKIWTEQIWVNNRLDGESKIYFESGGLWSVDFYEKGVLKSSKEYDSSGKLIGEKVY
jgi:antitoxin component YwqK of YwqJK toxin-antitoxin module